MRLALILITVLVWFGLTAVTEARQIRLGDRDVYPLGLDASVLEDPDRSLILDDIVAGCCENRFRPATAEVENHGMTSSAFWYRIPLQNDSPHTNWIVEVPDGLVLWLDVAVVYRDGRVDHQQGGAAMPVSAKRINSHNQVFPVDIPPGESVTLLVRVASDLPVMIPINLWHMEAYISASINDAGFHIAYFGFMTAMVFYNLFLGVMLRDKSYVYYSLYFLSALFLNMNFSGFLLRIGVPLGEQLIPWVTTLFFLLSAIFSNRFTYHFLQTPLLIPGMRRWLDGALLLSGLMLGATFLLDAKMAVTLTILISILSFAVMIIAACIAVRKGFLPARYYLLGWVGLLLFGLMFAGMTLGVLPRNTITYNGLQIGSAVEALVFSFALASRMRMLQSEKQAAISQLARQDKMAALGLVSAGIAHEINNPTQYTQLGIDTARSAVTELRSFLSSLMDEPAPELEAEFSRRFGRIEEQLSLAREGTGRISEIVRSMRSASRGDADQAALFSPSQALLSTVALVRTAWKHVATIEVAVDETATVNGRASAVGQVFMNLLVNACHAIEERLASDPTPGVIEVRMFSDPSELRVVIRDNGCGMSPETLSRLNEPFFTTKNSDRGTGLGMGIVRRILESHGGRLEVDSTQGKGSTITVVLPLVKVRAV
jgi:two-component system NtrC family sensor kinase